MQRLSSEILKEILETLPLVREELKVEFQKADEYSAGKEFYSDNKFIEILPYAAYEYIILSWGVEPMRIDIDSVYFAINNKRLKDLKSIMAHGLRRLASLKNGQLS